MRPTEESDLDPSVLEKELEHVRHATDHQRAGDERGIADRDGEARRRRADRARLVDEHEIRRVRAACQVAGEVRQADPDKHDLAVGQLARGHGSHHLVGCVVRSRS